MTGVRPPKRFLTSSDQHSTIGVFQLKATDFAVAKVRKREVAIAVFIDPSSKPLGSEKLFRESPALKIFAFRDWFTLGKDRFDAAWVMGRALSDWELSMMDSDAGPISQSLSNISHGTPCTIGDEVNDGAAVLVVDYGEVNPDSTFP